jgi:hypothetical protein
MPMNGKYRIIIFKRHTCVVLVAIKNGIIICMSLEQTTGGWSREEWESDR